MTKKPSEKNKAWEKERRDRLNKSFDSLAKLLPNYDPSVIWTKIEIIQKSILYIEVLQQRNKKYLATKDPQELKKYNELIDAIKYFQSRNGQLSELLKKSKIALPPLALPKYLCDNTKLIDSYENDQNEIKNSDESEKLTKEINQISKDVKLNTIIKKDITSCTEKKVKSTTIKPLKQTTKNDEIKSKPVRTVTVTSTVKPDILITEEAKLQNDNPSSATNLPADKTSSLNQSNIQISSNPCILPTIFPTLIKIENLPVNKKSKKANSNQIIRKLAKDQNGKIKILPQPHLKLYYRRADGKMPIPVIRKKIIVPVKKRKQRKRKIINNEETCDPKKIKLNEKSKNVESDKTDKVNNDANYENKTEKKINDIERTNLTILHIDKNSGTVSPTAAFLESFPVVASTTNPGKLCETQNMEQIDVLPKICEINKATDSENLENLNNFFATNEYNNYCAQTNENIRHDLSKLDNKKLANQESIEEIKSPIQVKKPEIKILDNVKIETSKPVVSKEPIKTEFSPVVTRTMLNEKITTSLIPSTRTTNISNTNSLFNVFPPITVNPLTSYASAPSTLNLINYISTPSTIFSSSTQFLSNFPDFSNSIVRKPNIKRNSCKFNLSTKGPICTPLPLDSKAFITQNYSTSSNCRFVPSNNPISQTSLDNFNISKTGSSDVNYSPMVTTSSLLTTNFQPLQNMPKTLTNNSTSSVTSQNIITTPMLSYTNANVDLQNNKSLPVATNIRNLPNSQNYQTSFENFNLKTYSAGTNVSPESSKNSVEKASKISKHSKALVNVVNTKASSINTNISSSSVSNFSNNSKMLNSTNLYPAISSLNTNFTNVNSSINQISSSNLQHTTTAISDITSNLSNSKTISKTLTEVNVKNVYSNLKSNLPQFNPYPTTLNTLNSNAVNTIHQSDKMDVKITSTSCIPSTVTSNTIASRTYSYCTNSSIPTDVKSQSSKFHPYAANFGIPIITTIHIPSNSMSTYSTVAANVSNYPTKRYINPISANNATVSNTIVTYTTTNSITMTTKSSETEKSINSNVNSRFLNTKSTSNTNYQPFISTLSSNIMPSPTNTTIATSQFVLRPYDFLPNPTNSISSATTVSYLPSLPYTTSKSMVLPTTYTFSTCTSVASNYSNPTYTNLTTLNNNNYSVGNTVYSNPTKNYYYPLQTETSTTFSFSLTTTTNSQMTPLITPQTQSILTYQNLKSEMPPPWIPAPSPASVAVTNHDYKTPFTFSLTPTTTILTTTTKSSSCILNSTSTSNHLLKNPQIPLNSYNSATNFTFSLTTPKSTQPVEATSQKSTTTTNLISKNYQTNYPIYNSNFDSQLNFNQKDTTNFTFALTKSTNSVADIPPAIIPNNKFENLYTNNENNLDNKSNQEITVQNSTTTAAGQFKVASNKTKVNGQKLNKKNITQIGGNEQNCYDCEQNKSCAKIDQKSHVNWMTSSSENTSNSKITQYFPAQNHETILPWSPNKIYDNNLQQTYYGESSHYADYPINSNQNSNNSKFYNLKTEKYNETTSATLSATNQPNNNNNFFSVSQLVDQTSATSKSFTNTENFNQNSCQHSKISPTKSRITKDIKVENQTTNNLLNLDYPDQQREQKPLTISNTYSAEALISKKEKHRNFNPTNCNNNNPINPTDFYSSSIDQLDTIICDQNNYHTNNYFYNYHHHQQSINHQNYGIQSEIDYLVGGSNINAYENEEYNKTILNKIDKKLYPPSSYPPPITPAPPPPAPPLSTSNSVNVSTFLPYDTNYGHIQYYHGATTITPTSSVNSSSNYQQASNWTKGLHYTNSSCVVPQYHHSQQILTPIISDPQHGQNSINSQTVTGNLTNFNLSSICPEINDKVNSGATNNEW